MLIHVGTKGVTTIGKLDSEGNVVQKTDLNWECLVLSPAAFQEIIEALLKQKKLMEDQEAASLAAAVSTLTSEST